MTAHPSTNHTATILALLAEFEGSIADYPQDLRNEYALSKKDFEWADDTFGDERSEHKDLCSRDLALIHRLMFASAFAASISSLPSRDVANTPVESTTILDVVTEAGLPARDFLRYYGMYGNQFTWKLMKLTGRISENSRQPAPNLVKGV